MVTVGFNPSTLKVIYNENLNKICTGCCIAAFYTAQVGAANVCSIGMTEAGNIVFSLDDVTTQAWGIARDSEGSFYIVGDRTSNKSIWKFNSEGILIDSYDTGNDTRDIKIDAYDNIFVVGLSNAVPKQLWKLDTDLTLLDSYDTNGHQGAVDYINAIAFDGEGNIYLGGWIFTIAQAIVRKIDKDFNFLWDYKSVLQGQPTRAIDVDIDGNSYIGTAEGANVLSKINTAGVLQWKIPIPDDPGTLGNATNVYGCKVAIDGNIYVACWGDWATGVGGIHRTLRKVSNAGVIQWSRWDTTIGRCVTIDDAGVIFAGSQVAGMVNYNAAGALQYALDPGDYILDILPRPTLAYHISACNVTAVACDPPNAPNERIKVEFTVVDADDVVVEGAEVFYEFSGEITGASHATTDVNGIATDYSACVCETGDVTATVTDIRVGGITVYSLADDDCNSDTATLACP